MVDAIVLDVKAFSVDANVVGLSAGVFVNRIPAELSVALSAFVDEVACIVGVENAGIAVNLVNAASVGFIVFVGVVDIRVFNVSFDVVIVFKVDDRFVDLVIVCEDNSDLHNCGGFDGQETVIRPVLLDAAKRNGLLLENDNKFKFRSTFPSIYFACFQSFFNSKVNECLFKKAF